MALQTQEVVFSFLFFSFFLRTCKSDGTVIHKTVTPIWPSSFVQGHKMARKVLK